MKSRIKKYILITLLSVITLITAGYFLNLHYFYMGLNPFINSMVFPSEYKHSIPAQIENIQLSGTGDIDVILIAGAGFDNSIFHDFALRNSKLYRMALITLPGFGKSNAPPLPPKEQSNMEQQWLTWAEQGITEWIIENDFEQSVVIGYFFVGGDIAMRLAINQPQLVSSAFVISDDPWVFHFDFSRRKEFVDEFLSQEWFPHVDRKLWALNSVQPELLSINPETAQIMFEESNNHLLPILMQYTIERNAFDLRYHLDSLKTPIHAFYPRFPEKYIHDQSTQWVIGIQQYWEEAERNSDLVTLELLDNTGMLVLQDLPDLMDSLIYRTIANVQNH